MASDGYTDPYIQERFGVRPVQGKVKHTILREYSGAWAGIIINGVRRSFLDELQRGRTPARVDLVYLDGFGGSGRYGRDFDDSAGPIWGSPVIGVRALEEQAVRARGIDVRVTAFISEQDSRIYPALVDNLHAAHLRTPVVEVTAFAATGLGSVNVLKDDFRRQIPALLTLLRSGTGSDPFVFAFVDPYGPTMSMAELQRLLGRRRTDAIVLFPYYDLEVRSGSAAKNVRDRHRMDHQNVEVRNAHFGSPEYEEIAQRSGLTAKERELAFAALYSRQLHAIDNEMLVKNIPLQLGEIARTAYHLFLVTRNADGAFRMNDVLRDAAVDEHWIRWQGQENREQAASRANAQVSLELEVPLVPEPKVERRSFTPAEVSAAILDRLGGRALTAHNLYRDLANTLYTAAEVNKGLALLKKHGLAEYDSLSSKSALVRIVRLTPGQAWPPTVPTFAGRAVTTRARGLR